MCRPLGIGASNGTRFGAVECSSSFQGPVSESAVLWQLYIVRVLIIREWFFMCKSHIEHDLRTRPDLVRAALTSHTECNAALVSGRYELRPRLRARNAGYLSLLLASILVVGATSGCTSNTTSFTRYNPEKRFHTNHGRQDRIVIGITDPGEGVFDTAEWAFIKHRAPWQPLSRALKTRFGVPVAFRQLKPFQVAHLLQNGRCDFAIVSNEEFHQLTAAGTIMKEVALAEPYQRQGVLVTRADSDIKSLEDFRDRAFAFGPRMDPVLFYQALEVLDQAGISPSDLRHETVLTGFDGALQNHRSSREAAYSLIYGRNADGAVIEASEFDGYPETGGRWLPVSYTFSKDQFRELARTRVLQSITLSRARWIAAPHVDNGRLEQLRLFLVSAHVRYPEALHALGFGRFSAPEHLQTASRSSDQE